MPSTSLALFRGLVTCVASLSRKSCFSGRIVLCLTSNPSRNAWEVFSVAFLGVTSAQMPESADRFRKRPPFLWTRSTIWLEICFFSFFLAFRYGCWYSATMQRKRLFPMWLLVRTERVVRLIAWWFHDYTQTTTGPSSYLLVSPPLPQRTSSGPIALFSLTVSSLQKLPMLLLLPIASSLFRRTLTIVVVVVVVG